MLPGSTLSEAMRLIKRMHSTTSNCILPLTDRQIEIRFRHGAAELKANETAQELLGRARHEAAIADRYTVPVGGPSHDR